MKKHKAKFTPEVISKIESYAAELKPLAKYDDKGRPMYRMSMVDGIELLRSNALDSNGNPGVPGFKYKVPVLVYANHKVEMEEAFKNQGVEGIEAYYEYAKKKRADNEAEVAARLPWWTKFKRWFKKIFRG